MAGLEGVDPRSAQQAVSGWALQLPPPPPKALGIPRRETRAIPGRPGARSGEGMGPAEQGLGGQHSSQHLWTSVWSESGRCGFVATAW